MRERQTRPGAHDRVAHMEGEFCRDRENSVTIEGRGSKELYVKTGLFLFATERCVGFGN